MNTEQEVYFGVGSAYAEVIGSNTGLIPFGEVDQFDKVYNQTAVDLPNNQTLGGGTLDTVYRIDSMEIALKMRNFSTENFAMAVFGAYTSVVAGSVLDEESVANIGTFIPTEYPGITEVTCQEVAGGAGTDYIEGVDYELRSGGIYILSTFTGVAGSPFFSSYDHPGVDVIQALVNSGKEFHVFLDAMNEARSGAPFTHDLFRVKFGPAATMALLGGGEYGEMALTGRVLPDSSKTGANISKYCQSIKTTAS